MEKNSLDGRAQPYRVTTIVKALESPDDPICILQDGKHIELLSGAAIDVEIYKLVQIAEREEKQLISTLLLNTPGGYVSVGTPVSSSVGYMRYYDFPTVGFVRGEACSYGGHLLKQCASRIVVASSDVMFHQTYYDQPKTPDASYNAGKPFRPPLVYPRQQFRNELLEWLKANAHPSFKKEVLERARQAFSDRDNYLDDVWFKGWEFVKMGLAQEQVSKGGLARRYSQVTRTRRQTWHPKIQEFFT